jgi:hypothetical protein
VESKHFFGRGIETKQLTVDVGLTNTPGDKLAILGAKVKDNDRFTVRL